MIVCGDILPQIENPATYAASVNRAADLFKPDALKACAKFAAAVHERAADYIEQAPVLAIAVMAGGGNLNGGRANRAYAAHKFGSLCARGGKLRDVMAAYRLPLVMRKLKAKALSLDDETALALLAKLPPSLLSQSIPDSILWQRRWLSSITAWQARLRYLRASPDRYLGWAATQIAKHRVRDHAAADLADFAVRGDVPLNSAWEWPRAEAAARDWHDRLSAGDAKKRFGVMADQIVDLGKHPDHAVIGDFEFIALRTPQAIFAEGQAMRHCVATYVQNVVNGSCSIVSIQHDELRVATLELRNGRVAQLKGRFNATPASGVKQAADAYALAVRKAQAA